MRKIFVLAMVALLSLTMAFALMSCGQKQESSTTTETTPPAESGSMSDTSMNQMSDTSMADTSMSHMN